MKRSFEKAAETRIALDRGDVADLEIAEEEVVRGGARSDASLTDTAGLRPTVR